MHAITEKLKQIEQVRAFRDGLKDYYAVCNQKWRALNQHMSVDEDVRAQEKEMREKLTEEWGRLERLFLKIGAPTHSHHPMAGVTRAIFDDALSFDFEARTVKGGALEAAIQSATKAIGLLDALSDVQYKTMRRTTPKIFVGHSFQEEHKTVMAEIISFVNSFPVSVATGEKPTLIGVTKGVPEKVKSLIDDADIVIAILTKDERIGDEKMISSKWVSDEIAYALGKSKTVIRLLETGAEYKPAISGDAEYISFDKENLSDTFHKLSGLINSFLGK